jgi:hypothetical protein
MDSQVPHSSRPYRGEWVNAAPQLDYPNPSLNQEHEPTIRSLNDTDFTSFYNGLFFKRVPYAWSQSSKGSSAQHW